MNDRTRASDRARAAARAAESRFAESRVAESRVAESRVAKSRVAKSRIAKSRPLFDNDQVERIYARWAPFYDPAFAQVMRWGRAAAVASANRHIGGRVLDVGVGTGLELPLFDPSLNVVGIDLSEPMLRRAARRAREADLRQLVGLTRMDACRLAFADASFDVVIAPFVLTVLPRPEASLDEWVRVLRPNGEIVLVNHISAQQGPIGRFETWLGRYGASLGWRPEFPWAVLSDWLAARPHLTLVERRVLPPFGLFTLTRINKSCSSGPNRGQP